jgi:hypothetical protein
MTQKESIARRTLLLSKITTNKGVRGWPFVNAPFCGTTPAGAAFVFHICFDFAAATTSPDKLAYDLLHAATMLLGTGRKATA